MKKILMASAFALASYAGTAQAGVVINFSQGGSGPAAGTTVFQDFSSYTSGQSIGTNSKVYSSSMPAGSNPGATMPTGASGNFAATGAAGSYTATFNPANIFSFVLGSLDTYNEVTLFYTDGTVAGDYFGGQIIGLSNQFSSGPAYGSATNSSANGVVSFTTTDMRQFGSVTFKSANTDSLEYDTLAAGVPEPAAWGMMIVGFGLVGGVLRRRQAAVKVRFA